MNEIITSLFGKNFAPHGYCLAWEDNLLALHVLSDTTIFVAYLLIPVFLGIYLLKKGGDLREHRRVLALFALFILGCGFTHLMGVITIWQPWYYQEGLVKLLTAIVSMMTAGYLFVLFRKLVDLPGLDEVLQSNRNLQEEILLRKQKEAELFASQIALRNSESLKSVILDNAIDGIITLNENGIVLSFNKSAELIFQYNANEIIGQSIAMLMPDNYNGNYTDYIANYLRSGLYIDKCPETGETKVTTPTREVEAQRKNKSVFPLYLGVSEMTVDDQLIFCAIVRDITESKQKEQSLNHEIAERKASESALRESRAFQLAILNNIVDGIITIDESGVILCFNKAAETIFKYPANEVLGQNIKMLMPTPYAEAHDGYLANYIRTHDAKIIGIGREVVGLCKDGSTFPMDLAVSEVNVNNQRIFAGIVRNISERKQAEVAAKHFQAIIQSSDDAIISKTSEGIITSWNPGAEAMFGYTANEVVGRPMLTLIPEDRKNEEHLILERIKKGEKIDHFETVRLRKDGTLIDISATISPMRDRDGKIIGASKIARDISEQKKAEAALVEAKKAAEIASRAKSEFLANMSHEIRTPLNGVIGMIELVLDSKLDEKQLRFLKIANDSAGLLLNVINDILDFSKIEAKKLDLSPHAFNLRDSVDICISSLAVRAHDKSLELVCSVSPDVPDILIADSVRIQQVLINLIGNAIKFTEHGEIVVRIEPMTSQDMKADDSLHLHVSVKDSGMGIAKNKQEQIFAAFAQSDASMTRTHGGTGLGLAISQQLVTLMGGRIWVESELGKGSTFHFTFRCSTDKDNLSNSARPRPNTELKGLRVLIVDDNSTNCLVLCEILSSWDMKPFSTEQPQKALEILQHAENINDPFKLVITDYQMPDMTGIQLAKAIRNCAAYKDIPILVLSSVSSIDEFEKLEKLALVNGFIDKPVRQSTLLEKVQSIVGSLRSEEPGATDKKTDFNINLSLRILVAEDNPTNQMVIGAFFEKQGLKNVILVDNGLQAVKAYQKESFDVIFMDVRMPEMDGFQATAAIRDLEAQQNLPRIPIVALTAHALKEDEALCLEKGMDYYTSKPIKTDELLKLLTIISATLPANSQDSSTGETDNWIAEKKTDHQVINQEEVFNLEAALAPVGGDMAIFKRIIGIYLKNYQPLFEQLKQAVLAKDSEAIYDRAHALKGSAGNFAAHKVVNLAAELEKMGKTANISQSESVLAQLEIELYHLKTALSQFQNKEAS